MFLYIHLCSASLFLFFTSSSCQELKYKVVAPEYICSKENMSLTTIRLIGDDVPYLKYNWSVSFRLDEVKESRNMKQRRIIIVWESVRKLNEILQHLTKEDINRGIIYINNSLLTPNVKYIINLVVQKRQNGRIITDKQQIVLDYIGKTNKKSSVSLYLSGPEIIYSDMLYTAKAEVNSCTDTFDYQLSWELFDKSNKMIRNESTNSQILHLAPSTLSAGKEYSIKCIVVDKKSKKNKTSVLRVNVLERGMQLSTYINLLKIGLNQSIYLNAFFSDPDAIAGRLMFEWKCKNSANKGCSEFESSNTTELLIKEGFSYPGRYLFTLTAKKGDRSVQDSSMVDVVKEMLPVINVENAITSCNPSDAVMISVHVNRLAPGCTLQWTSEKGKGYEFLDLNKVPGKPGNLLKLEDEESSLETFSEENNDEDEAFIEKQFDFLLPSSADDSWTGLKDDSEFLFRLTASCPCLENTTTKNQEKFIISSADVIVTTNKLPLIKPLKVLPKSGQAIRTKFKFQTGVPYNSTRPMLYKFGIFNKSNKRLFLLEQYDVTSTDTILPFYDESIQTILEVCDSKRACNFTLGPKVIVKLPNNFTVAETKSLLNDFKKSIIEQDYFNAFTLSSMFLQTASQMSSNVTMNLLVSVIKNITKQEIQSFVSATDDGWLLPATNLLKHIKILDNDIHLPQDILNDILALRDKVSEKQNSLHKKHNKSEKLVAPSRKLLSVRTSKKSKRIVNDINIDNIKNYLEITEMAIKRLTEFERVDTEVQKLRDQLQYYIPIICQYLYKNSYKTNVRIELSTIILDVERINLVRKYNEFMFVPFEIDLAAKLQLGRYVAERYRRQNGMCLGKILFLDDYFRIPQYVFDVKLYSATSDFYLDSEVKNFATIIEMPVKSFASNNQMFQCVLWEDGDWDMSKCKTMGEYAGRVKCACRSLGYFSMVPVERTTTTSTTASSSTSKPSPAPAHELVTQQYNAETIVSTTVSTTVTLLNLPVTNEQTHDTVLQSTIKYLITSTEQTNNQNDLYQSAKTDTDSTNINSAAVWSISLLAIGIFTVLLAFLVLLRKLQRSKAVQNFQTIEYARYFDEHNLE